jgi:hypothetical protein
MSLLPFPERHIMSSFAKREPPSGPSYPSMPEAPTRNWPNFQPGERTLGKGDPAPSPACAGTHQIAGMSKLTVSTKDGKLFILAEPLGADPEELVPESDTQFFVLADEVTFTFE